MLRVRVFKKELLTVAEDDIERLLEDADCVDVDADAVDIEEEVQDVGPDDIDGDGPPDQEGEEENEEDDVTLIVVLTPECVADPDLENAVGEAVGNGGRAIGIWPPGATEGSVPAILDKIGSGTVVWDPEELSSVLTDDKTVWNTPAGEPRPATKTKRNKC